MWFLSKHVILPKGFTGVETLLAAISFQDSLMYMIYNASEDNVPDFGNDIHRFSPLLRDETTIENKYGISILPSRVASNPINQKWIQGIPPFLINELAPLNSRALDALACSVRSLVDRAKARLGKKITQTKSGRNVCRKRHHLSDEEVQVKSVTELAVEQYPVELSSCNLLAQASSLTQCEELSLVSDSIFCGPRLLVKAVELVLETAIKDVQIHNIFTVLEVVMEHPIHLFQFGPTYHIIHSCVIVLARKINEIKRDPDSTLFEKALNIYNESRSVLEHHRTKLPILLQCQELPIPGSTTNIRGPVIDVSNVSSYFSRNCSGSVVPNVIKQSTGHLVESEQLDANDQVLLALLSRAGK
jgi:hypothetical protein